VLEHDRTGRLRDGFSGSGRDGGETLHRSLGRNAAEYALNYTWEKVAKQIMGVYEELMGD